VFTEEAVFARNRGELRRDYFVRLPSGLYLASTRHARAGGSVHLCNHSRAAQLPRGGQKCAADSWHLSNRADQFQVSARPLTAKLRSLIAPCDAVIHLAGFYYGAEPSQRPSGEPRRSYTQIEYDVARELRNPLFLFLAAENCGFDDSPEQSEKERTLQLAHRRVERLGCRTCFSGADCTFLHERDFIINEKLEVRASPNPLPWLRLELPVPLPWLRLENPSPSPWSRVALPGEVSNNLKQIRLVVSNIAGKLGHPNCCSGFDIQFRQELDFVANEAGEVRDRGF
jgi:hypothetical protein